MRRLAVLACLLGSACSAPTEAPDDPRLAVGFLIVDGVYNTELTAPYDIFHHSVFHTEPGMRVFTIGPDRSPVTSFEAQLRQMGLWDKVPPPAQALESDQPFCVDTLTLP